MNRYEKRKAERQSSHITKNAKVDMLKWIQTLDHSPSNEEALAWQQGYLSGINRITLYLEEGAQQ